MKQNKRLQELLDQQKTLKSQNIKLEHHKSNSEAALQKIILSPSTETKENIPQLIKLINQASLQLEQGKAVLKKLDKQIADAKKTEEPARQAEMPSLTSYYFPDYGTFPR